MKVFCMTCSLRIRLFGGEGGEEGGERREEGEKTRLGRQLITDIRYQIVES